MFQEKRQIIYHSTQFMWMYLEASECFALCFSVLYVLHHCWQSAAGIG